jgi:hypothetical protein
VANLPDVRNGKLSDYEATVSANSMMRIYSNDIILRFYRRDGVVRVARNPVVLAISAKLSRRFRRQIDLMDDQAACCPTVVTRSTCASFICVSRKVYRSASWKRPCTDRPVNLPIMYPSGTLTEGLTDRMVPGTSVAKYCRIVLEFGPPLLLAVLRAGVCHLSTSSLAPSSCPWTYCEDERPLSTSAIFTRSASERAPIFRMT